MWQIALHNGPLSCQVEVGTEVRTIGLPSPVPASCCLRQRLRTPVSAPRVILGVALSLCGGPQKQREADNERIMPGTWSLWRERGQAGLRLS